MVGRDGADWRVERDGGGGDGGGVYAEGCADGG